MSPLRSIDAESPSEAKLADEIFGKAVTNRDRLGICLGEAGGVGLLIGDEWINDVSARLPLLCFFRS